MNINNLKEMIRNLIEEIENEEEMDEVSTTGGIAGYNTPKAFGKKSDEKEKAKRMAKSAGYSVVNEAINIDITNRNLDLLDKAADMAIKNPKGNVVELAKIIKKYVSGIRNSIKESIVNEDKIPTIIISKKQYQELQNRGKVVISKLATGFRHSPNPKYYKQFPKNLKNITVKNPITNSNEMVDVTEVEHEPQGIYIHIKKSKNEITEATNRFQQLRKEEATPNQKIGKGIREMRTQIQEIEKFVEWYSKIKTENDLDSSQYWKRTQKHLNVIRERLNKISQKIQNLSV
jgi:tetrahydromethanopterin S-methyltransferase subunit G